jgi:hypothetical protein
MMQFFPLFSKNKLCHLNKKRVNGGRVHQIFLFSSFTKCPGVVFAAQAKPIPIESSLNKGKSGYLGLFMMPFLKTGVGFGKSQIQSVNEGGSREGRGLVNMFHLLGQYVS